MEMLSIPITSMKIIAYSVKNIGMGYKNCALPQYIIYTDYNGVLTVYKRRIKFYGLLDKTVFNIGLMSMKRNSFQIVKWEGYTLCWGGSFQFCARGLRNWPQVVAKRFLVWDLRNRLENILLLTMKVSETRYKIYYVHICSMGGKFFSFIAME